MVTYADIYSNEYIDKVIAEFYNVERIAKESSGSSSYWRGNSKQDPKQYYTISIHKNID